MDYLKHYLKKVLDRRGKHVVIREHNGKVKPKLLLNELATALQLIDIPFVRDKRTIKALPEIQEQLDPYPPGTIWFDTASWQSALLGIGRYEGFSFVGSDRAKGKSVTVTGRMSASWIIIDDLTSYIESKVDATSWIPGSKSTTILHRAISGKDQRLGLEEVVVMGVYPLTDIPWQPTLLPSLTTTVMYPETVKSIISATNDSAATHNISKSYPTSRTKRGGLNELLKRQQDRRNVFQ